MVTYFKNFVKHSTMYAIGNGISRGAGIVLVPLYTRVLLPADYGALEMFYVTASILRTLLGMMIAHATLRFYFEFDAEIDKKRVISTSLIFSIFACLLAILALGNFKNAISMCIFKTLEYRNLFGIVFVIVMMELSREIALAYLRAKEKSFFYVSIAVAQLMLQIGLNLYMVLRLKMGIGGILLGNMLSVLVTWLILMAYTFKYCGLNFHLPKLKILFHYCFPFALSAVTGIIINNADRVALSNYTTLAVVGVYALAMKFGIVIRELIVDPFTLNFGQSRFAIMKQHDARAIYSRVMTYYVFAITSICLLIVLFLKEILAAASSAAFQEASRVVPIVILPAAFAGMSYIFQTGMLIEKKTRYTFYISALSAILMIVLSRILVPRLGMYGAGLANIGTAICACALNWYYSHRLYPVKYEFARLANLFLLGLLIYAVSLLFNSTNTLLGILAKMLLFFSFPLLLAAMGWYKKEEKNKISKFRNKSWKFIRNKLSFGY